MSWTAFLRSLSIPFEWWVVVAPWEQGIRVRRGKRAKALGSGLHFKVPFLDRVYVVSTRKRMISDSGQTMMTKDGHVLTINTVLQFSVVDALRLFESIANPEQTLLMLVQARISEVVAAHNACELSPTIVGEQARTEIPTGWGLSDVDVRVTTFARVRTYRLMMNEYRSPSGLDNLLAHDETRRTQ
jgi:regulator of protease activity HflC (stomatin/prohibitin superfamily)